MEDIDALEPGGGAARWTDATRPSPRPLQRHQGLQQGVVGQGVVAGRAAAPALARVVSPGPDYKLEPLQFAELHRHLAFATVPPATAPAETPPCRPPLPAPRPAASPSADPEKKTKTPLRAKGKNYNNASIP